MLEYKLAICVSELALSMAGEDSIQRHMGARTDRVVAKEE